MCACLVARTCRHNGPADATGGAVKCYSAVAQGHESTIEDVVFKPGSKEQLVSVGDDQCLLLWDTRSGNAPATRVKQVTL